MRRARVHVVCSIVLASAAGMNVPASAQEAAEQPQSLDFGLSAGATWSDNVLLLPDDEQDGTIGELGVELLYNQRSRRLQTDIDLNASYQHYLDDNYDDDVVGGMDGTLLFGIVPERFEWFVQDNFGQTRVDALAASTPDNSENVNYFTTGPDVLLRFSSVTSLRMSGRYSSTEYETSNLDGERYGASLALIRQISSSSSLSLNAVGEKLEYDDADAGFGDGYDRYEGYLRYALANSRNSLGLDVGYTGIEDDVDTSDGGLLRLSLERRISPASTVHLKLGSEFSDAGNVFRATQDLDGVSTDAESVIPTSDALERRFAFAGWTFNRNRTSFGINGDYSEEKYENSTEFDRTLTGYGIFIGRQLTPALQVRLDVGATNEDFDRTNIEIDELHGGAALEWLIGRTMSLRFQYQYRDRDGSTVDVQQYTENRASLFLTWYPVGRP